LKASVPRGLELQLATTEGDIVGDTSIMANLGYFQFKAQPGLYNLNIREGRGRDVYSLHSLSTGLATGDTVSQVALTSFTGLTVRPVFERQPGMELADVLDEVVTTPGFFDKIYSS
jgi:UDP-glucose:glycoprotein glucosyltransferase